MTKPAASQVFYVPQKPYLCLGTLRDQVIYPHTKSTVSDDQLRDIMRMVHLEYLIEREGGWDTLRDWTDILSGGECQRIGMSRLFYHRPIWAVLDECTSATSVDVEGLLYEQARKMGITLFTISHRQSLFKFHEKILRFDGAGGYTFGKLDLESLTSH